MLIKELRYSGYIFLLYAIVFCSPEMQAQKKTKIHAKGISVSHDKNPKEALKEALIDARENALKNAGISEFVSVTKVLFAESNINDYKNQFNEISSIESNANIVIDSIYAEMKSFDNFGNMVVSVEIDATVFKYKETKDPMFFFEIDKLNDVYNEDDNITFSFVPSQDGYLTIFVLNERETILLYPYENVKKKHLSDPKDRLFKKNEKLYFPVHKAYSQGYTIELESDVEDEVSNFIFVFKKKNIPWIGHKLNRESILKWIYMIPLDQREIYYKSVLLKNTN